MPHGDIYIPDDVQTKSHFYQHILETLEALLENDSWITNTSNTASLLYHAFLSYPTSYGETKEGKPVCNWSGFYFNKDLYAPSRKFPTTPNTLLLGPFNGRPACQTIRAIKGKGVCADAYVGGKTVIVEDVEAYPGHIACDGDTRSEIVVPLLLPSSTDPSSPPHQLGVLDIDSVCLSTFDEDDRAGLEKIAELVVRSCDWGDKFV